MTQFAVFDVCDVRVLKFGLTGSDFWAFKKMTTSILKIQKYSVVFYI